MAQEKIYSIHNNRIRRGTMTGFTPDGNTVVADEKEAMHMILLQPFDGVDEDARWQRFVMHMELAEDAMCTVYIRASNDRKLSSDAAFMEPEKYFAQENDYWMWKRYLEETEFKTYSGKEDIILYEHTGRYLWLCIELVGEGTSRISDMMVSMQSDDFMPFFPEVYREWNGFFHRYLSIFSTMYTDFRKQYEAAPQLLDVDKAPIELLPALAEWLGINLTEDFLEEKTIRSLVKEAPILNRMKGTRYAIERITKIILDENPTIIENNVLWEQENKEAQEDTALNYGDSRYDVTVMLPDIIDEGKKQQYAYILNQFIPVRCKLHILYLKERSVLDKYTYLDINAQLGNSRESVLDTGLGMDNDVILKD